jgi:uncharacterized protein (TIGR03382 family)
MKTSLQIRSLRTAGLALALGLGLAAASHSAQAAIVQITLGGSNWTKTDNSNPQSNLPITGLTSTSSGVDFVINTSPFNSSITPAWEIQDGTGGFGGYEPSFTGDAPTFFSDTRINSGSVTKAIVSIIGDGNSTTILTRVVFNDAGTTFPSNFNLSSDPYSEWSATSTAVPEPGTFIPAAVLVAGALLRRRRSRSHRTGRATS